MSNITVGTRGTQPRMDLLKPDLKGLSEERKRIASLLRIVFLGVALIVWTFVGLKVWDISLLVSERKPEETEKARLSQEISDLQTVLAKVPQGVLQAKEDLYTQIVWSERLGTLKEVAGSGVGFGVHRSQRDGDMQVNGVVRDPATYADLLDTISKVDFVTQIKSASLSQREGAGYEFHLNFITLPTDE